MTYLTNIPNKSRLLTIKLLMGSLGCGLRDAKMWADNVDKESIYLGNPPPPGVVRRFKGLGCGILEVEAPTIWEHLED